MEVFVSCALGWAALPDGKKNPKNTATLSMELGDCEFCPVGNRLESPT